MYGYWVLLPWLVSDCTVNYRPVFSSARTHWKQNNVIVKQKEEEQAKIWSRVPKGGPIPRRTGRLTVGRKKNSNPRHMWKVPTMLVYFAINLVWRLKRKICWRDLFYRVTQMEFICRPQMRTSESNRKGIFTPPSCSPQTQDDCVNRPVRLRHSSLKWSQSGFKQLSPILLALNFNSAAFKVDWLRVCCTLTFQSILRGRWHSVTNLQPSLLAAFL
jgi:hypothetical protein